MATILHSLKFSIENQKYKLATYSVYPHNHNLLITEPPVLPLTGNVHDFYDQIAKSGKVNASKLKDESLRALFEKETLNPEAPQFKFAKYLNKRLPFNTKSFNASLALHLYECKDLTSTKEEPLELTIKNISVQPNSGIVEQIQLFYHASH